MLFMDFVDYIYLFDGFCFFLIVGRQTYGCVCALTTFSRIICVILNFAMLLSIAPTLLRTIDFLVKY